jgi:hypothetical protein
VLEVDWSDRFLPHHFVEIASFLNINEQPDQVVLQEMAAAKPTIVNAHVQPIGQTKNLTELEQQDRKYRQLLGTKECTVYFCTFK